MILYCERQSELITVRSGETHHWCFTCCYEEFAFMMQEKNPGWCVSPGEHFVVDLEAEDVTGDHSRWVRAAKVARRNYRRSLRMGTGTGGTKAKHMWQAGAALLTVGVIMSFALDSVVPVSVALGGVALEGACAFIAYGLGKFSYNIGVAKKE